jgi:hypothetical protein
MDHFAGLDVSVNHAVLWLSTLCREDWLGCLPAPGQFLNSSIEYPKSICEDLG